MREIKIKSVIIIDVLYYIDFHIFDQFASTITILNMRTNANVRDSLVVALVVPVSVVSTPRSVVISTMMRTMTTTKTLAWTLRNRPRWSCSHPSASCTTRCRRRTSAADCCSCPCSRCNCWRSAGRLRPRISGLSCERDEITHRLGKNYPTRGPGGFARRHAKVFESYRQRPVCIRRAKTWQVRNVDPLVNLRISKMRAFTTGTTNNVFDSRFASRGPGRCARFASPPCAGPGYAATGVRYTKGRTCLCKGMEPVVSHPCRDPRWPQCVCHKPGGVPFQNSQNVFEKYVRTHIFHTCCLNFEKFRLSISPVTRRYHSRPRRFSLFSETLSLIVKNSSCIILLLCRIC